MHSRVPAASLPQRGRRRQRDLPVHLRHHKPLVDEAGHACTDYPTAGTTDDAIAGT
ncbi:MAG: hypothetical protein GXP34_01010 [Actinobacteria bacterium]|nr:hypothetical protein [Actinomycetota bacterium]